MPYTDREKQKEYQRRWLAERRAEFFTGKVCCKCGSTEDLELDHIDSDLKVSHNIWSWKEARRLEELKKCQVLCKKCHLAKTIAEDLKQSWHGGSGMYQRGCRCEKCVKYNRDRCKMQRARAAMRA